MDSLPYLPAAEQQQILDGPALAPPAGIVSNFDNPPNNNGLAQAVIALCITVATLCLIARLYAKLFCARKFRLEDYLICCAYGTYIGWSWCAYNIMGMPGYFVHQWDVTLRNLGQISYIINVAGVLYSVTLPLLKIAIMLEWIGMFVPGRGNHNAFWWACCVIIAIQLMLMVASVVALCFACVPYAKIWNFLLPGKCIGTTTIEVTSSCIHLACDVAILCLPHKVIWGLNMSFKKKLAVALIFSLGLLACVSAAFRVSVTVFYIHSADTVYSVGPVIFWAFSEMTCGFVVVCTPAIPKLIMDTGIGSKIKRSLKSLTGRNITSPTSSTSPSGSQAIPKMQNASNMYRKMDEFDMPLEDLKQSASQSTEYLNKLPTKLDDNSIVRTTQIDITRDYSGKVHPREELGSYEEQFNREIAWHSKHPV